MAHVETFTSPRNVVPGPQACADDSPSSDEAAAIGLLEWRIAQQARVHDAVEGAAAGIGDPIGRHQTMQPFETMQGDILKSNLA